MSLQRFLEEKKAIIDTMPSATVLEQPAYCADTYRRHLASYVILPDLESKWKRVLSALKKGERLLGLIWAPVGYGKTAAAISLWSYCESQKIVATPPFKCTSLRDIAQATYGWLKERIRGLPGLTDELDKAYGYLQDKTLDEYVDQYSERNKIPRDHALRLIRDMIRQGHFLSDVPVMNLVSFLSQATDISLRAGYSGLVVIPDEFKLFIESSSDRDRNITAFKDLVMMIRPLRKPLAFIVCALDDTVAELNLRAPDVVQRLTEDGVKEDLQDRYGRTFPAMLWESLSRTYGLSPDEQSMVTSDFMESLCQFCADRRLANGPRSVIAAFRRAAERYLATGSQYNVVSFIEDYLAGLIAFDNKDALTKQGLNRILATSVIQDDAGVRAAKLLAAYPEGCPAWVSDSYGLTDRVNHITRQLLGDLVITRTGGNPTLSVYKIDGPADRILEALKSFRVVFNAADPSQHRAAVRAFCNLILPQMLPPKRGSSVFGWSGLTELDRQSLELIPYTQFRLNGAPSEEYPERTLTVRVTYDEAFARPAQDVPEYEIGIVILLDCLGNERSLEIQGNWLHVRIPIGLAINPTDLPTDIARLGDIFMPRDVTPLLLLALCDYLPKVITSAWSETDKTNVETMVNTTFVERVIREMFNERLSEVADFTIPPGRSFLNRCLLELCKRVYPHYVPLASSPSWQKLLNTRYLKVLNDQSLSLSQRRGHSPISGTKEQVAKLFGFGQATTAFDNSVSTVFRHLVEVTSKDVAQFKLVLTLHPIERNILSIIDSSNRRVMVEGKPESGEFYDVVWQRIRLLGYTAAEFEYAVNLLQARAILGISEESGRRIIHRQSHTFSVPEMMAQLEHSLTEFQAASIIWGQEDDQDRDYLVKANNLRLALEKAVSASYSDETLDELNIQLKELLELGRSAIAKRLAQVIQKLEVLRAAVAARQSEEIPQALDTSRVQWPTTEFSQVLHDIQTLLSLEWKKTTESLKSILEGVNATRQLYDGWKQSRNLTMVELLKTLVSRIVKPEADWQEVINTRKRLLEAAEKIEQWIDLARAISNLRRRLIEHEQVNPVAKMLLEDIDRRICYQIRLRLVEEKERALDEHAVFSAMVKRVKDQWDSAIKEQGEAFNRLQQRYMEWVRNAGITSISLSERFSEADPEGSYDSLRQALLKELSQVCSKAQSYITEMKVEILKADKVYELPSHVHELTVELRKRLTSIESALLELQRELDEIIVRDEMKLKSWLDRLATLTKPDGSIADLKDDISRALSTVRESALTESEQRLFDTLKDRGDLTEVIVDFLSRDDREIPTVEDIFKILSGLYRKGRINVDYSKTAR